MQNTFPLGLNIFHFWYTQKLIHINIVSYCPYTFLKAAYELGN